jgi:drug/metabolite transporter (DMT)-like permease
VDKNNSSPDAALVARARFLLISATLLWGLSFPLMRGLELAQRDYAPHVSDLALASADMAVRFGVAALFLLPFSGRQMLTMTGREWSQASGLATLAGVGLFLQTLGLAWTDASISAFLTQLYTLIVPLIVAWRDRRFPSLRVLIACVLVLIGAAMLSPGLLTHFVLGRGEIVTIIGTLFLAGQIVFVERPVFAENRSGVVTLFMFAILSVCFLIGFGRFGGTSADLAQLFGAWPLMLLTLGLVLLCTVFNFYIMNAWQRYVRATEAGLIYCIEPVIAAVLAGFLPGWISSYAGIHYSNEILSWALFVGGFLIVIATVLVATERKD